MKRKKALAKAAEVEKKIQDSIASPSKQLLLRSVALSATVEEQQEQILKKKIVRITYNENV